MMVGVPQQERYQMLAGNMVRVYDLPAAPRREVGT
jgi:trimethylamine:corrinoid methyltransferase-like protein